MEDEEHRTVLKYDIETDHRGRKIFKPTFLKSTPIEEIDRINKEFRKRRKKK